MPTYSFSCKGCGWSGERRDVKIAECDTQMCTTCGEILDRPEVEKTSWVGEGRGFETSAVLGNGQHLRGHFGRSAPKRNRWR